MVLTPIDLGLPDTGDAIDDTTGLTLDGDPLDVLLADVEARGGPSELPNGLGLFRGRRHAELDQCARDFLVSA